MLFGVRFWKVIKPDRGKLLLILDKGYNIMKMEYWRVGGIGDREMN